MWTTTAFGLAAASELASDNRMYRSVCLRYSHIIDAGVVMLMILALDV